MSKSADVQEAEDYLERIQDKLEQVPEHAYDKAGDFFDSVEERSKAIYETVLRTNVMTPKQREALSNMLDAVDKWIR